MTIHQTPAGLVEAELPSPKSISVWTERGSTAYRRIGVALWLAGFATFSLLYLGRFVQSQQHSQQIAAESRHSLPPSRPLRTTQ
jgi:hypothetical protein